MSDREEDRDRGAEDLFGDLDEFFAPIQDLPEGEQPAEQEGEAPRPQGAEGADGERETEPAEGAVGAEPAGGEGPREPGPDAEPGPGPETEAGEEPREDAGQPTAEMTGEEWEHLRGELGEEDVEPQEEPTDEGAPRSQAEEQDVEEPVLAEEATIEGEAAPTEAPKAEEASPEEVEAAAAHFASGIESEEEEEEGDLLAELEGEPEPGAAVAEAAPVGGEVEPTWQEPAAFRVEEEEGGPPPPTERRNLLAAVASAVILAVAAVALLAAGKGYFVVLAMIVVLVGQGELYAVLKTRGFQPATGLGLVAGAFIMAGAYLKGDIARGEGAMLFGLAIGMALAVLWYMAAPPTSRRGTVANVGATILGIVYVPFLVSFDLLLLAVPGDVGRNYLLTVVGLTVLYDVSAYAVGTLWGSRPLAPNISPRKSWEGAIGATFVLLLVALSIIPSIEPFEGPEGLGAASAVGLALVIAVAAPIGDLVESALKRDLGVKDMGSLLPGHGGVLDRIDAILFTAPAAYYYLLLVS